MPRIDLIPENLYESFFPYHVHFDNLPLKGILQRQRMINSTLDIATEDIGNSKGDAASLAGRLAKSLEDDGSLKLAEIDAALHSIEAHADTVDYVRMTASERDKLTLVEDEANQLKLNFLTAGPSETEVEFDNGTVVFADSVSVNWRFQSGKIYADMTFDTSAAHDHSYGVDAIHISGYTNFETPVPFIDGSLRVYVNGVRLFEDVEVYHPGPTPEDAYTLNKFTATPATGEFVFDLAVDELDVVKVDFDRDLT